MIAKKTTFGSSPAVAASYIFFYSEMHKHKPTVGYTQPQTNRSGQDNQWTFLDMFCLEQDCSVQLLVKILKTHWVKITTDNNTLKQSINAAL